MDPKSEPPLVFETRERKVARMPKFSFVDALLVVGVNSVYSNRPEHLHPAVRACSTQLIKRKYLAFGGLFAQGILNILEARGRLGPTVIEAPELEELGFDRRLVPQDYTKAAITLANTLVEPPTRLPPSLLAGMMAQAQLGRARRKK